MKQLFGKTAFWKAGAPEETRTPNPQIRSLVLYPIELRARGAAGVVQPARRGPFS
jgi:hypothetical protein